MIYYTKVKTDKELLEILELQKKNLPENLSSTEKEKQGFVTVKHSFKILKKMNDMCEHTVAKHKDKVVGYALSMTKDFANDIEILKPMFTEISNTLPNENYLVMGQICIDKEFRGLGVFRGLYNFMKTEICNLEFSKIITEIDTKNSRSLRAHKSVGFKDLKDYVSDEKIWRIVFLEI